MKGLLRELLTNVNVSDCRSINNLSWSEQSSVPYNCEYPTDLRPLRTLTGVIVDERHNYPSVPVLLLHIGKVVWVRKDRNGAYSPRVFIFWLEQNDWTTICNLRFSNRRTDVSNVVICRSEIVRCSGSKLTLDALKPAREATATRFGIDVLEVDQQTLFLDVSLFNLPDLGEQLGRYPLGMQHQRMARNRKYHRHDRRHVHPPARPSERKMTLH